MPADVEEVDWRRWYFWRDLVLFMLAMAFLLVFVFTAPGILASPQPLRSYVLIAGVVAELAGLTMALIGLYETWRKNAPGRSLYPWLARFWTQLRRRPQFAQRHAADHAGIAAGGTVYVGSAVGEKGVPSLQEQIDRLRKELTALEDRVNDNRQASRPSVPSVWAQSKRCAGRCLRVTPAWSRGR